jgi:hypothetical protein
MGRRNTPLTPLKRGIGAKFGLWGFIDVLGLSTFLEGRHRKEK